MQRQNERGSVHLAGQGQTVKGARLVRRFIRPLAHVGHVAETAAFLSVFLRHAVGAQRIHVKHRFPNGFAQGASGRFFGALPARQLSFGQHPAGVDSVAPQDQRFAPPRQHKHMVKSCAAALFLRRINGNLQAFRSSRFYAITPARFQPASISVSTPQAPGSMRP